MIEVEAVSIDGYLASRDLRIDLVKIDTEGSELEVFRGMERHLRESHDIRIIMELNQPVLRRLSDPGELCDYMQHLGFGFHVIEPPRRKPPPRLQGRAPENRPLRGLPRAVERGG